MNNFLVLFVDGVGIGKKDYENNPFFKYKFKFLNDIFGAIPSIENPIIEKSDKFVFPIDACLGVEGLPQSGTGQTSIFCGVNAPKILGKHFGPYPYSTLLPILKEQNIFKYFKDLGDSVCFANAYPERFFEYVKKSRRRLSVSTISCLYTDISLNQYPELKKSMALSPEITNEKWKFTFKYDIDVISPVKAARNLLGLTLQNKFTLFEFFLTDYYGHGRSADEMDHYLTIFDEFVCTLLTELDYENTTFLFCSDHGNLEDTSIKTHTLNPALTISAGKHARYLFENIKDLTDIKPVITSLR